MATGSKRIQEILRATPAFTDLVRADRILTVPLKRADMDEYAAAMIENAASTPQCFDEEPPHFLMPSVSIWSGGTTLDDKMMRGRYLAVTYTVAFYVGPVDYEETIYTIRQQAALALHRKKITIGTVGGSIWVDTDLSEVLPVPEFPGAGYVLLERVSGIGVWRRT